MLTQGGRLFFICMVATLIVGLVPALADDHHDEKHHDRQARKSPPPNQLYLDTCGGCHLAYPPVLLPSGSWSSLLQGQSDHFGQDLGLDSQDCAALAAYLNAYSANASGTKLARKIIRSLDGDTPLRITEVPYIIHKHEDDDVPRGAFNRKGVGSMANCQACHPGAANGDFDDDQVRIPPR